MKLYLSIPAASTKQRRGWGGERNSSCISSISRTCAMEKKLLKVFSAVTNVTFVRTGVTKVMF